MVVDDQAHARSDEGAEVAARLLCSIHLLR
jgi:hypothetical protein